MIPRDTASRYAGRVRNLVHGHLVEAVERGLSAGTLNSLVVSFDTKGFTAMSGALQAFGTQGAEALAGALDQVFEPIVDEVHAAGGFIAHFAGDGAIAVFRDAPVSSGAGVDDALGAAARAVERISTSPAVVTPAGSYELSVRAVVGSGALHWHLWSSSGSTSRRHRAYAYFGEALADAQRGEPVTDGGHVRVSPRLQRRLASPSAFGDARSGYARLLRAPAAQQLDPAPAPPSQQRQRALGLYPARLWTSPVRGEFRQVVSCFLSVSDPATAPGVLDLVEEHQGYVKDVGRSSHTDRGLTFLVYWGAPQAHERDAHRALSFTDSARSTLPGDVSAGVTTATLFAGFVGSERQSMYACVGMGVNLAARLLGAAAPGEVLMDQSLASAVEQEVGVKPAGTHRLKGVQQPVEVFRLTSYETHRPRVASPTSLRGRDVAMASTAEHLGGIVDGAAVRVLLLGEAGTGKSVLIQSLMAASDAWPKPPLWMVVDADATRMSPLRPWRDLARRSFGYRRGDAGNTERFEQVLQQFISENPSAEAEMVRARSPLAALVGVDIGPDSWPGFDTTERFDGLVLAIEDTFRALSARRPVVLVIEDLQWVDEASMDVLVRVAAALEGSKTAILTTSRQADAGIDWTLQLELGPLDRSDLEAVVADALNDQPSSALVDLVSDRSGGNPFFARQISLYLRDRGLLGATPTGLRSTVADPPIPTDLTRVLVARLDALDSSVRHVIQSASVLGREFELDVLEAIVGDRPGTARAVRTAVGVNIWGQIAELRYIFRNAMLRDAAYSMQLHASLRRLHRRAAEVLFDLRGSDPEHAAGIAEHHLASGDDAAAHPFLIAAGDHAATHFANEEALRLYSRATESAGSVDGHFTVGAKIVRVLGTLGERTRQSSEIDRLSRLAAEDPGLRARVEELRVVHAIAVGRWAEAAGVIAAALGADPPPPDDVATRLVFHRARIERQRGDLDAAAASLEESRSRAASDLADHATAVDFRGGLAFDAGDLDRAIALHRSAISMFRNLDDHIGELGALNNLGSALLGAGDLASAAVTLELAAHRSREIGLRMREGDNLDNLGGVAWTIGDYARAIELYREALAIRRRTDDLWGVTISLSNLGSALRSAGALTESLESYDEAIAIAEPIDQRRCLGYALTGRGVTLRRMGQNREAMRAFRAAIDVRMRSSDAAVWETKAQFAAAALESGDVTRARNLIEEVLAAGEDWFESAEEPAEAALAAYDVLTELAHEAASEVLLAAHRRMLARAERAGSPELEAALLRDVGAHTRLVELMQSKSG